MPQFTLTYFDIRGLAETTRFLFAIAKQDYTDKRFPLNFGTPGDFSTIQRPEFDAAKASGELDASAGKVPLLEVDGVKVGQSKAIERYVAKTTGLMGSSDLEACQIDAICEMVRDIKDAYQKVRGTQDAEEKKKAMEKWFAEDLKEKVGLLEKMTPGGPGPWLVGSKVSYADVTVYMLLKAPKGFFDEAEKAEAAFQDSARVKASCDATHEIPELKAWIEKRPAGTAPF